MSYLKKPKLPIRPKLSLKDFHAKHNQILIWHDKGGLGDVLMQLMMIKDFKSINPNLEIIFACLPDYMSIVNHPDIYKVIDSRTVNPNDYLVCYNTCVTIADRHEHTHAPCSKHRSDIWAEYCGVYLQNHDMCLQLDSKKLEACKRYYKSKSDKPIVLFAPVSKMATKTLLKHQIETIVESTKDCHLIGIHTQEIDMLTQLGISTIYDVSIVDWMHYIAAADYVISVDTAAFHMAGGLKKPLMGIFTFADGKVYGKHFDFILVQKHRDDGEWDCGPCFVFANCPKCKTLVKPCLTEINKEELQYGIKKLFDKWPFGKNIQ